MRTAASFASSERFDFRPQSETPPEKLLIGNATVFVCPQFPHQFLHRILQVQFPAYRQQVLAESSKEVPLKEHEK